METGLVDTDAEVSGVGRPRHRLVLGDSVPDGATGADLLARGRAALCE